ncbi:hypothetical protein M8C21_006008, partial [Ambrosia artemisiifolia]
MFMLTTERLLTIKFAILNTVTSTFVLRIDRLEPPIPPITMFFSIILVSLQISCMSLCIRYAMLQQVVVVSTNFPSFI